MSQGVCQICGEEREFENSPQIEGWTLLRERQRRDDGEDSQEEEQP